MLAIDLYAHILQDCNSRASFACKALALQECHCMLFLTEDNGFRGEERAITLDTIEEATKGMSGVQP